MANNTSWANRGKQTIAATPVTNKPTLKPVGGGSKERIIAYYRFTAPKKPSELARVLDANTVVEGTYDGSFTDQFEKQNHKVRTAEGLIALPGCARLDKAFSQIKQGAEVRVQYNGKTEITSGPGAGKSAHSFDVSASETND